VTTGGATPTGLAVLSGVALLTGCTDGSAPPPGTLSAASPTAAAARASGAPAAEPTRTVIVARASGSSDARGVRATEVVSRFYRTYLTRPGQKTAAHFVEPSLMRTLYAPPPDEDRVLCAHALPETATVVPDQADKSTATVRVITTQQHSTRPPIVVTVRLSDLRITRIACPS